MKSNLKGRLLLSCILLVGCLSILSARLIYIETFMGERLAEAARSHYEYKDTLPAQRGRIYDRTGELLARNQSVYTLVVDCYHLRDFGLACIGLAKKEKKSPLAVKSEYLPEEIRGRYRAYVAETLADILEMPVNEIAAKLKGKENGEVVLLRNVEEDFSRKIGEVFDEKSIGGVYLRRGQRRYYPSPLTLTQTLGYVNEQGEGVAGIEKVFNDEMRGTDGYRYCERDRRRREILAYRGSQVDPVPGRDVYLSIDMQLQAAVEQELDKLLDAYRPEKVSIVFMKPKSGEILAMGSRPHFDLTTRKGILGQVPVRRNIAVSDQFQPGSTFKMVGFAGAFDKGLANPKTRVDCEMGEYDADGHTVKDHHPYGVLSAKESFAVSSNVAAFKIARPLNPDGFMDYVKRFGFGAKTGIELTAESSGRLNPVEKWSRSSFPSQAIGYEVAVTPVQIAAAAAVIANGGVYRAPTVLKGLSEVGDRGFVERVAKQSHRVVSETAARQLTDCMISVTQKGGTGVKAALPGYEIAGKTGTARKHVTGVGYVKGRYIASFVGFFPAKDPEILGLVLVDDPKANTGAVYGGTVAAPTFRNIAEHAVRIFNIEPDFPEQLELDESKKLAKVSGSAQP